MESLGWPLTEVKKLAATNLGRMLDAGYSMLDAGCSIVLAADL
ncbi:hypothetical protein ACFL09_03740 [Planctomycetota bacterium]